MPALTKEQKIYLALWRKAYREGEPMDLPCGEYKKAVALRMALYRAIMPYRQEDSIDEELKTAAEVLSVNIDRSTNIVWIAQKSSAGLAEMFQEMKGVSDEDLLGPEEKAIMERMENELGHLITPEKSDPFTVSNPFYTKDER